MNELFLKRQEKRRKKLLNYINDEVSFSSLYKKVRTRGFPHGKETIIKDLEYFENNEIIKIDDNIIHKKNNFLEV